MIIFIMSFASEMKNVGVKVNYREYGQDNNNRHSIISIHPFGLSQKKSALQIYRH